MLFVYVISMKGGSKKIWWIIQIEMIFDLNFIISIISISSLTSGTICLTIFKQDRSIMFLFLLITVPWV